MKYSSTMKNNMKYAYFENNLNNTASYLLFIFIFLFVNLFINGKYGAVRVVDRSIAYGLFWV